MSWDRKARGAAGGYYYRSVRRPDRPHPVKEYCGRGAAGQATAAGVEAAKQKRKAERASLAAEQSLTAEADELTADLADWAEALASAWMSLAGHRRHHREWRISRG